jgi:hypothetical protein
MDLQDLVHMFYRRVNLVGHRTKEKEHKFGKVYQHGSNLL